MACREVHTVLLAVVEATPVFSLVTDVSTQEILQKSFVPLISLIITT